ncbi:MAG: iron-containing alcohol dehydrogenase [Gaiellaceae bacterium]
MAQQPDTIEIVSPRRLVAGDGSIDSIGTIFRELGIERGCVLVVSDETVVRLGLAARAVEALRAAGLETEIFGEIAHEPDLPLIERIEELVRDGSHAAVLGVGGGSALDPAKLAAALPKNDGPLVEYIEGRPFERPALPLVLAPTTAGTGAEASRNSVVTQGDRKRVVSSPYLCADVALLDPTLTTTAPPSVTAASGVDALCHAIESALSTYANPFTLACSFAAMHAIPAALPVAYDDGDDLQARRSMLYASYLAGLSLNAVTILGHTMGYTIASRTRLGHGVTCAMSLPYCLAYNLGGPSARLDEIARSVGSGRRADLPHWARALCRRVGIPESLAEVGIPASELEAMVDECLEKYPRPNNPVPFQRDRLLLLYRCFHEGDIDAAVGLSAA